MKSFDKISIVVGLILVQKCESQEQSAQQIDCEHVDLLGRLPFKEFSSLMTSLTRQSQQSGGSESQFPVSGILQSPELTNLMSRVATQIQNRPLLGFVGGIGMQLADVMDRLTDSFHAPGGGGGGEEGLSQGPPIRVGGVIRQFMSALPSDQIRKCYNLRLDAQPAFQHVMDQMDTPEFQNAVDNVRRTDRFQQISSQLQDHGTRVNAVLGQAMNFLGQGGN